MNLLHPDLIEMFCRRRFHYGGVDLRASMGDLMDREIKKIPNLRSGYAYAVATYVPNGVYAGIWNDANKLVWGAAGWGTNSELFVANAVRLLRTVARTSEPTIELVRQNAPLNPRVERIAPGSTGYPWGDLPEAGGTLVVAKNKIVLVAVSSGIPGKNEYNHRIATALGNLLCEKIAEIDGR